MERDLDSVLGPVIDDKHLAALKSLPVKPAARCIYYGLDVALVPYDEEAHAAALWAQLSGEAHLGHGEFEAESLVWQFLWGRPADLDEFKKRMAGKANGSDSNSWVIKLRPGLCADGAAAARNGVQPGGPSGAGAASSQHDDDPASWPTVGTVSLICSSVEHLKVEIGFIIIAPALQGTPVACTTTYLLLRHCFELGYRRVEWKTHVNNKRSRAAAERMGFVHEGMFRCHYLLQGHRSRDTAWYSIIHSEWPEKRAALEEFIRSDKARGLYHRRMAQLKEGQVAVEA